MFYTFDTEQFPIVQISLHGNIENKKSFESFIERWEKLYDYGHPFYIVFNTEDFKTNGIDVDYIQYVFMIATFLRRMKKEKLPLLQRTVICVYRSWVSNLLRILFKTHSPLAPVYIIDASNINYMTKCHWSQFIVNNGYLIPEMIPYVTYVPSKYIKEDTTSTSTGIQTIKLSTSPNTFYSKSILNETQPIDIPQKKNIKETIEHELQTQYIKNFEFSPSSEDFSPYIKHKTIKKK